MKVAGFSILDMFVVSKTVWAKAEISQSRRIVVSFDWCWRCLLELLNVEICFVFFQDCWPQNRFLSIIMQSQCKILIVQ
jgi:hypothetical protein